ncbi:MAG TPA: ABC transporter permease [Gemmatimonadales bacterium]|nr:ABC transporter permease [Gemmatimonadales bacterium]
MDALLQDLRFAIRQLLKSPGFTLGVVLTLGLGIGANVAMFSIVDRMLFRPPPMLRDPSATHRVYLAQTYRGVENADASMQYARYVDLTAGTTSFTRTAAFTEDDIAVGVGAEARELRIGIVSASFFAFFDAPPALGRYFSTAEDAPPAGTPVAVLGHGFWQTRYGGRADILGSTLQIGPVIYTIIGVTPRGFTGLWPNQPPVAFVPISTYAGALAAGFMQNDRWWTTYSWDWMSMLAQRKPGISTATATADLTRAFFRSFEAERAGDPTLPPVALARPRGIVASVLSERGPNESSFAKVATWVSGVAVIVLLIACANVTNLLLARGLRRRREIAIRLALGVTRGRLLAQLLTESVGLAVCGGIVGLVVAEWGGTLLRGQFLTGSADSSVFASERTLLFAAAAALLAGVLTGLVPAFRVLRPDLSVDLKAGTREGTYQRSRTRAVLLVSQCALSVALLVGAGLFVRSLGRVRDVRLGYDVDPVLIVDLNMRGVQLDSARHVVLRRDLLDAARSIPGVRHVSPRISVPFLGRMSVSLYVAGIDSVRRLGRFLLNAVGPDYFATMGTQLVRGRGISDQDAAGAPGAMVVSAAMAGVLWPGREAIGQCVHVRFETAPCAYVVGIAENIHSQRLGEDPAFTYYLSSAQWDPENGGLFVRMAGPARQLAETVRRRLQEIMPGASYVTVVPFAEVLGRQTRSWQLGATMFLAFGALAVVVAAIGLYSVLAYNVAQRTHELGVRAALGADQRSLIGMVVREALAFGAAGIAIGALIALACGRWLGPLLFQESPRDPLVFGGTAVLLIGIAALASFVPSRRAAAVDPVVALRTE